MQYLLIILKYLPLVMQLVQSVEQLLGDTVPGVEKKAIIIDSIKGTAANLQVTGAVKAEELTVINSLIDSVVSVANTFGVFGKKLKK